MACVLVIAIADLLIWRAKPPYAVDGLLDEPAHLATGLLALAALATVVETPLLAAVVAGSLLIDLDHLPHVFGSYILEQGVPRPYTHSLGTIVVLLVIAALLRARRRELLLVAAAALALHFLRDMAEPGGPGISLLWPLSDSAPTIAYGWYAVFMAVLAVVALARRDRIRWPRRRPPARDA